MLTAGSTTVDLTGATGAAGTVLPDGKLGQRFSCPDGKLGQRFSCVASVVAVGSLGLLAGLSSCMAKRAAPEVVLDSSSLIRALQISECNLYGRPSRMALHPGHCAV